MFISAKKKYALESRKGSNRNRLQTFNVGEDANQKVEKLEAETNKEIEPIQIQPIITCIRQSHLSARNKRSRVETYKRSSRTFWMDKQFQVKRNLEKRVSPV